MSETNPLLAAAAELRKVNDIGSTPVAELSGENMTWYFHHPMSDEALTGQNRRILVAEWLESLASE